MADVLITPGRPRDLMVEVMDDSEFPIERTVLRWRLRDGHDGQTNIGRIDGAHVSRNGLTIPVAPRRSVTIKPFPGAQSGIDELTLDRWVKRAGGWRLRQAFSHLYTGQNANGVSSYSVSGVDRSESELA